MMVEKASGSQMGRGPAPELDHAGTLISDFQPSKLRKQVSVVYKQPPRPPQHQ